MAHGRLGAVAVAGAAMVLALILVACGSPGGSKPGGSTKVALVQVNQQAAFFNQLNAGAAEAARDLGVSLSTFNANNDPAAQADAIRNFAQQGYKAIIVDPIDLNAIKPEIKQAHEAGVRIIAVEAFGSDPAVDVQVGTDNGMGAVQAGQWLIDWAKTHKVDLKIGVVSAPGIQTIRSDRFVQTLQASGAQVLQTVNGQNVQERAATAAQNLFTAQPDMNLLYATGEPALIGAVAAERDQGAASRVPLFGWDLSPQAIQGIDQGVVIGVVQQDPKNMGRQAVEAARQLIDGGSVARQISIPVTIVTQANVDAYRSVYGS